MPAWMAVRSASHASAPKSPSAACRAGRLDQPALFRGKFLTVTGEPYIAERLVLPLSGEGAHTDMILGAFGITEDRASGAPPAAC